MNTLLLAAATDAQTWQWVMSAVTVVGIVSPIVGFTWFFRGWLFKTFPSRGSTEKELQELRTELANCVTRERFNEVVTDLDQLQHQVRTDKDRQAKEWLFQESMMKSMERLLERERRR